MGKFQCTFIYPFLARNTKGENAPPCRGGERLTLADDQAALVGGHRVLHLVHVIPSSPASPSAHAGAPRGTPKAPVKAPPATAPSTPAHVLLVTGLQGNTRLRSGYASTGNAIPTLVSPKATFGSERNLEYFFLTHWHHPWGNPKHPACTFDTHLSQTWSFRPRYERLFLAGETETFSVGIPGLVVVRG